MGAFVITPNYGRLHDSEPRRNATCRTCGEECTWHHTGVRWVLLGDNYRPHVCDVSDDFEVLTEGST